MISRFLVAFFMQTLLAGQVSGADRVWIVGGGPTLPNSQAQIERNVKWEREVILRQVPAVQLKTFFSNGESGEKDVVEWRRPHEDAASLQPLARVFGAEFENGESYSRNSIPGIEGGTQADQLITRLRGEFSQVKPNDKVLFIFYGHGHRDPSDATGNALRLWNDTRLSARDLGKLLTGINPQTPVRFFLPQCFSGGFARMIYSKTGNSRALKVNNMCGFMAVADDKQSEGCSSSVNVGDYRDYTSYFFAALDGRTRLGRKLPSNPDLDGNGRVTLREAHFYSLVNGESTDVPRATSEVYLEEWEPWYLRRMPAAAKPDNIYRKLLHQLASKHGLSPEDNRLQDEARKKLADSDGETVALKKEQGSLRKEIDELQGRIRADVLARWPGARFPYTDNFRKFMRNDLDAAQLFIMHHAGYAKLVRMQERNMELDVSILASNRRYTQFERMLRLHKLAKHLDKFDKYASQDARAAYGRLVSCEDNSL